MKYLLLIASLIPSITDRSLSGFYFNGGVSPIMSSPNTEEVQWKIYTKEYCFLSQELSFGFSYEFSPIAIATFSLKKSMVNILISLEIDETNPIKYQTIADEWQSVSLTHPSEKICFKGAYLPAQSIKDPAFILVSEIRTNTKKVVTQSFALRN